MAPSFKCLTLSLRLGLNLRVVEFKSHIRLHTGHGWSLLSSNNNNNDLCMYATVITLVNLLSFGISFNVATGSSFIFFSSLQETETNIYLVPLSLYVNRHFPCLVSCVLCKATVETVPQAQLCSPSSCSLLACKVHQ